MALTSYAPRDPEKPPTFRDSLSRTSARNNAAKIRLREGVTGALGMRPGKATRGKPGRQPSMMAQSDATYVSPDAGQGRETGLGEAMARGAYGMGQDFVRDPFGSIADVSRSLQREPLSYAPGEGIAMGKELTEAGHPIIGTGMMAADVADFLTPGIPIVAGMGRLARRGAADVAQSAARRVPGQVASGDIPGNWFTAANRAAETGPRRATAAQWEGRLIGRGGKGPSAEGGVSSRETERLGLADFLDAENNPDRMLSKEEVSEFISARSPRFTETVLDTKAGDWGAEFGGYTQGGTGEKWGESGGTNYGEIRMQLDPEQPQAPEGILSRVESGDTYPLAGGTQLEASPNRTVQRVNPETGDVIAEGEMNVGGIEEALRGSGVTEPMATGGHSGVPGEIARIRHQSLTDMEGNRVFSIEELQAELHSKGKTSIEGGPDVPMSAEKEWTDAAIRRAFREAIDSGHTRISLPTGAQIDAVPNMGTSTQPRIARYYDKTASKRFARIAEEFGATPPQRSQIFEFDQTPEMADAAGLDIAEGLHERVFEAVDDTMVPIPDHADWSEIAMDYDMPLDEALRARGNDELADILMDDPGLMNDVAETLEDIYNTRNFLDKAPGTESFWSDLPVKSDLPANKPKQDDGMRLWGAGAVAAGGLGAALSGRQGERR